MNDWHPKIIKELIPGESPYYPMFRLGCSGIPWEQCRNYCDMRGIPLRPKDLKSWEDGMRKRNARFEAGNTINPIAPVTKQELNPILTHRLDQFPTWPEGWEGTPHRWFPVNERVFPMIEWGYKSTETGHDENFYPQLMTREQATQASPVGWASQNLYGQPIIMVDVDGVGHGPTDLQVINWGNKYRGFTEIWEDPMKQGSFHIYFKTQHVIPIGHFLYANLDVLGNNTNAACHSKNKRPIDQTPMATLTQDIWYDLQTYLLGRKEERDRLKQQELSNQINQHN